jgi:hypothetical protein
MPEYNTLREKIAAEKAERLERYAEFQRLYDQAQVAGLQAGYDVTPTPMIVGNYPPVMDGVCGFAWVAVAPRNSSFGKWLVKEGLGRSSDYHKEVQIWISAHEQSYTRKVAHAQAMADVFNSSPLLANTRIYATGRLD